MKFAFLLLLPITASAAAPKLSLDNYLEQVSGKNPGLRSAQAAGEGNALIADSANLLTTPYVFANTTWGEDRKETTNPAFMGTRTKGSQYTLGMMMDTPIGLNAVYSYNVAHTEITGATLLPVPNYYTAYNKIELTQSLLANAFGSGTRARVKQKESQYLATAYSKKFEWLSQMMRAESTYWELAYWREAQEIQKDELERAKQVLDWAKRRVNMQLGTRSDLLQAQAVHDLRRMELVNTEASLKIASRAFNLMRNQASDSVTEEVSLPSVDQTLALSPNTPSGARLDLKAAEAQEKLVIASANADQEAVMPTLNLVGTYAWNGFDPHKPPAVSEAWGNQHPTKSIGVVFKAPLAVGSAFDSLKGNNLTKESASFALEQKRIEVAQGWLDLSQQLNDARTRLNLLGTIEKVQREKVNNEQDMLKRGRSTTYQALTFQQDYANSQLLRLRTQLDLLKLVAQSKLYRGEQ